MLRASIDLGTNTVLLLIRSAEGGSERVIADRSTMVRLGKGVDQTRRLDPEAMARTIRALETYAIAVKDAGLSPSDVVAVTTATARDAENGADFFQRIEKDIGFKFRVLSGPEEAHASFLGGLLPGMSANDATVFDLGGGSLEFQRANGKGISLQVGSVRFTERHLKSDPVTDEEFWACREAIEKEIDAIRPQFRAANDSALLVGVAGTVVTLGALHLALPTFDREALDGLVLTRGDVHRLVEELKWRSRAERLQMPGMEKGREDVILAGALIVWRILEGLGYREMTISTRGLRYGVIAANV